MTMHQPDLPEITVIDDTASLPPSVWKELYRVARTGCIPVIRLHDAGRQFVVMEAEDFARLQDHWIHAAPPNPDHPSLHERVHGTPKGTITP